MNKRKHNLSFKIPNVKLRPAPQQSEKSSSSKRRHEPEERERNAMDEEILKQAWEGADDEETSSRKMRKTNERPWKGIVITFTGVEEKPLLSEQAKELGAIVENALTISVTHVVAAGYGSPKYLYAVEHRLPVLAPSWVATSFANWQKGSDLDVAADVEAHRLAPFIGLRIAISGIEPLERRKQIMNHITALGGIYSKDLDRQCTHLVSSRPANDKPSEKIKWALNEVAARAAKARAGKRVEGEEIKLVYEQWVWDCVAYRGRWKEDYYDIKKPRRDPRANPDDVINGTFELPAEPQAGPSTEPQAIDSEPALVRKRKREGMPTLVDEIISVTGIKSHPALPETDVARPDSPTRAPDPIPIASISDNDSTHREKPALAIRPERKPSMLHVSRTTSFTAAASAPSVAVVSETTAPSIGQTGTLRRDDAQSVHQLAEPSGSTSKLFQGLKFSHIILDQKTVFEKALVDHGAILVPEEDRQMGEEVDYVVVRLSSPIRPWMPTEGKIPQVVTECWVEGCFFEQKLLNPERHVVFRLLDITTPIPSAAEKLVHLSGFSAENSVYLRRLLRVLGFTQSQSLNRKTTHLVCAVPSGLKFEKAHEWGVSVVKDTWLLAAGRNGQIEDPDLHRHEIGNVVPTSSKSEGRPSGLTSGNMSHMLELGSGIIDSSTVKGLPRPSHSSPANPKISQTKADSQGPSSISPSRMLKLTPTHVDDISTARPDSPTTKQYSATSISISEMPLSPPRAEAARRLNTLMLTPQPDTTKVPVDGIGRTNSAPAQPESAERRLKTGSVKNSMVEALKMLAENREGQGEERKKQARRSRPGSRIKNNVSATTSSRYGTPPSAFTPSPQRSNNNNRHQVEDGDKSYQQAEDVDGLGDQSIMVKYVDANAEKEKKRLKDALRRGEITGRIGSGKNLSTSSGGAGGWGV